MHANLDDLLNLGSKCCIHEMNRCNHPLSQAAQKGNRVKPISRFVLNIISLLNDKSDKITRNIRLERNKAWLGLDNLIFNFQRYLLRLNSASTLE